MTILDWPYLAAAGVVGAVVLLLGLRGRRVDALPRCRRRRCRYDLTSFLGETRPGRAYPVTCPECGRVAQDERAVKWGKRRARRWVVALVLALTGAVGGMEIYTRTQNINTIAWLPLFMLLDRAPKDTQANAYVHQIELLRRADAGEIDASDAARVVRRILAWQKDESVDWGSLGDVFASLAEKGYATDEEVRAFWEGIWLATVRIRTEVWEGDPIPFDVLARWRGHGTRGAYPFSREIRLPSDPSVSLPSAMDAMPFFSSLYCEHNGYEIAWWDAHAPPLALRGPAPGFSEFAITFSTRGFPLVASTKAGQTESVILKGSIDFAPFFNVLSEAGLRTQWAFDRAATVQIVPPGRMSPSAAETVAAVAAMNDLRAVLTRDSIFVHPDLDLHTQLSTPPSGFGRITAGAVAAKPFAARAWLRIGETETSLKGFVFDPARPLISLDLDAATAQRASTTSEPMYLVLRCNDFAVRHAADLEAWGGEIVLPIEAMHAPVGSIPLLLPPQFTPEPGSSR